MRPIYRILADGKDITALLQDRLLSISITDKAGVDADELTIKIDDREGKVAMPRTGAMLEVSLGYEETGLTRIGRYRIDEIGSSGPPQAMTLSGRPANMASAIKQVRRHSWDKVSLATIVADIAKRNKLKPVCQVKATVARADQFNESDLHFITRLAGQYDATATIKGEQLLVLPRGGQNKSRSGKVLPTIVLHRRDITSWSFKRSDRKAAVGAVAKHHDKESGKTLRVLTPGGDNQNALRVARHASASPGAAGANANASAKRAQRSEITLSLNLCGRADLVAERKLRTQGIKEGVDHLWTIDSVMQEYVPNGGWTSSVELILNKQAEPKKKGKGKQPAKQLKAMTP
ncbi:phage late control D family protein [Chitinimonas sp. PSY-7]|uniref:phage late control D family protein n=1 Tax=Chitinimonas sp. PSY-7 TaxID=3459088 RepID=UPI00404004F5